MRIPKRPPSMAKILKENARKIFMFAQKPEFEELKREANERYVYWEPFCYWKMPPGYDADLAWTALKFFGRSTRERIPLLDKSGQHFSFCYTPAIRKMIYEIDRFTAGEGLFPTEQIQDADRDRYRVSALMEEAIWSSKIEGAATTRDVAKKMLRWKQKPANKDQRMIYNNYAAINRIRELVADPLSPGGLIELQKILTDGTLKDPGAVGRFRKEGDNVTVVDNVDRVTLHIPPPAGELEQRIEKLCEFANDTENRTFIHPVIRAILLHFWLGYDHPFVDGNGRTARAIFYWYAIKSGYKLFEYIPISRMIQRAPAQYARAYLHSEMDDNDATYFLHYNLRAITVAIEQARRYIKKKWNEGRTKAVRMIRRLPGINNRQIELLSYAIRKPNETFTIEAHKSIHKVVYQTARADLLHLEKLGFFEKRLRGKRYEFFPAEDLQEKLEKQIPGFAGWG